MSKLVRIMVIAIVAVLGVNVSAAMACSSTEGIQISVTNRDSNGKIAQNTAATVRYCASGVAYQGATTYDVISYNATGGDRKVERAATPITLTQQDQTVTVDNSAIAVDRLVAVEIQRRGANSERPIDGYVISAPSVDDSRREDSRRGDSEQPQTQDVPSGAQPAQTSTPAPQQIVNNITVVAPEPEPTARQNTVRTRICTGTITTLRWRTPARQLITGKLRVKGSVATAKRGLRVTFVGTVRGCKPGTTVPVIAHVGGGRKVLKARVTVRSGGRFTGRAEMYVGNRVLQLKARNSRTLKLVRF